MIMLSYFAGLRVGEISTLNFGDIYSKEGEIKDQIRLAALNTKTKEARVIFVNKTLKNELWLFKKSLSIIPHNNDPLFKTQKGTRFSPNTLCQLFKELYSQAGIDGATSHSGRRWFITKLAHSGVSAKVIMELAGHRNLSTTQRYIEVNDEMKRQAVDIL